MNNQMIIRTDRNEAGSASAPASERSFSSRPFRAGGHGLACERAFVGMPFTCETGEASHLVCGWGMSASFTILSAMCGKSASIRHRGGCGHWTGRAQEARRSRHVAIPSRRQTDMQGVQPKPSLPVRTNQGPGGVTRVAARPGTGPNN